MITLFAFWAGSAWATDIIVDQHNPRASDQNPGTKDRPLKTISAAAARVKSGDHVIIHGGDYRETVIIKASGTSDAPIVFEAAPGETPVIKGSDIITGWNRVSPNVWKANPGPIPTRSNKSDAPSFWRTNDVRQVFTKDGVMLEAIHLRTAPPDALQPGNFFCDRSKNELYVCLKDTQDANRLTIEASVRGAWLLIFGDYVNVRGLALRHSSTLGIAPWPACVIKGNNVTLDHCSLTWADFVAVSLGGSNDTLSNCLIACNGCEGIGGTGQGHLIERCRVLYNNINRYYFDWHAGGAKLIPNFSNGRILHNEFAFNIGVGLWFDGASNDNLIEGNFSHDNEGAGIMVEISARNRVFNNVCMANRNPLAADFLMPDDQPGAKPNTFKTIRRGGEPPNGPIYHSGDGRGIYVSSSPETKIFHNTSYLNEAEGISVEGPLNNGPGVAMSTHDSVILNNICAYNKGAQLVLRKNGFDAATYGNKSDYNLLVSRGGVLAEAGWGVAMSRSVKDWQQATGNDEHSLQADPSFAMAAMGDFRLLPISAAAHAATPLTDVTQDFFAQPRPKDAVSMGAFEVTATDYPRPLTLDSLAGTQ
ncbi:MAG TPA: right-handed parallel beta-helix repeat-containing protein [Chthoniobacterales bacterium]